MWHLQANQCLQSPLLECASLGSKILPGESAPVSPENAERRNYFKNYAWKVFATSLEDLSAMSKSE